MVLEFTGWCRYGVLIDDNESTYLKYVYMIESKKIAEFGASWN